MGTNSFRTKRLAQVTAAIGVVIAGVGSYCYATDSVDPLRPDRSGGLLGGASTSGVIGGGVRINSESMIESLQVSDPEAALLFRDSDHKLELSQSVAGQGLLTEKFQHTYKGLPVVGSQSFAHRSVDGALAQKLRHALAKFSLETKPTLSAEDALAIARATAGTHREASAAPELKILPSGRHGARLTYWIELEPATAADGAEEPGRELVIDAHTGAVIADTPDHVSVAAIEVYEATNTCQAVDQASGMPKSLTVASCRKVVGTDRAGNADASARRAARNTQATLKFYADRFDRDSFDDKGATVVSVVHVGRKLSNAFWHPKSKMLGYGDGDGVTTGDFTAALDVAGHELTHAVTTNTAALLKFGHAGALNESYSDVLGKLIEGSDDWVLGRAVYLDGSRGFRDLANPHSHTTAIGRDSSGRLIVRPQPAHIAEAFGTADQATSPETCSAANDFCFVHVNSTIPSHAGYRVIQALGRERAAALYYATLTQFLPSAASFSDARDATLEACDALSRVATGFTKSTCARVQKAFAAVGL